MAQPLAHHGPRVRVSLLVRMLAAVVVAVALVAGIFLLGRIAADDRDAMLLTTAWFGVVGAAGLLAALRRRALLVPIAVGFAVVVVAVAAVTVRLMFDDVVNERVVTGTTPGNVEVAGGAFEDVRHDGTGRAAVVRLRGGERKLTLINFETANGPDLFVYLVAGRPTDEGQVSDHVDLGRLKGNKGNQQYSIPRDVDLRRYSTVVIWCRAFTALFTRAELRAT
jgi:hypothetical protein